MDRSKSNPPWNKSKKRSSSLKQNPIVSAPIAAPSTDGSNSSITCRSSAGHVASVMAKFDERKKDLVRSIGFGTLLDMPQINRVNRKFSLWLLTKTSWENSCIQAGDEVKINICAADIERIIGLPATGKDVVSLTKDEKMDFIEKYLYFLGDEHSILGRADSFVRADLPEELNKQTRDQFKIAFVIFIMGRFLAPTVDFYVGNWDFWSALVQPDDIGNFNWSGYVLGQLLDAARVIEWAPIYNNNISAITGCPLLLQIMYFDNIDLGPMNLEHDVFPRIKVFDCTILGKMIQADTDPASDPSNPRFGYSKLRKNSCYSVRVEAQSPSSSNAKNPFTTHNTTLQRKRVFSAVSTSSMSDGSPISTTSAAAPNIFNYAVPNFSALIRNKYPDHHQMKLPVSGIPKYPRRNIDQRKRYDDLLSGPESGSEADNRDIMHTTKTNAFVRKDDRLGNPIVILQDNSKKNNPTESMVHDGFPILTSMGAIKESKHAVEADALETETMVHDGFPILNSTGAVKESKHGVVADALETVTPVTDKQVHNTNSDIPCSSKISHANSKHGSRYKTPNAITRMAPLSPELSPTSENKLHSDFALSKKTVKLGRFAKSHWSFGQDHPERDPSVTHVLLDWLSSTKSDELERSWILHDIPRLIERNGHDFKKEFVGCVGLSYELFDVSVRRIKQLDSSIYPSDVPLRWRHILESDFAMHALANETPANNLSIREQFIDQIVDYELPRCRMIIVPVHSRGLWWAYAFDLREHNVFIIDPSSGSSDDDIVVMMHSGTINLVQDSLKSTVSNLFNGWDLYFNAFEKVVVRISQNPCKSFDSGFFTLYCIKNFNGDNNIHINEAAIIKFKHYLLYELFGLKENRGFLPSVYVQTIDD
ncbi:unnamed protein product [Urochloa decumbens]|uniref:Ubiquitin-like protease family profile domain-containing protein n=1 Tax=Urochloa decumbens TaxID=240449 RepID=A0ABC8W9A5_9POAL